MYEEDNYLGEHFLHGNNNFGIKRREIKEILEPKNIRSRKSHKIIENLGGIKSLCEKLDVDPKEGLISGDYYNNQIPESQSKKYYDRIKNFGLYDPQKNIRKYKSFLRILIELSLKKIYIFIILVATFRLIIDKIYGNYEIFDYITLYSIVIFLIIINTITRYIIERLINTYKDKVNEREVRVLRNKEQIVIPHAHVLVGDILIISAGDITVVDGIIIRTSSLAIQNKDGRIHEIKNLNYANNDQVIEFPILLNGTRVIQGYGFLLVLNVECYEKNKQDNIPLEFEGVDLREVGGIKVQNKKYAKNGFLLFEDYSRMEQFHKDNNCHSPVQNHINSLYKSSMITAFIVSLIITSFYVYEIYSNNFYLKINNYTQQFTHLYIFVDSLFYFLILLSIIVPMGVELSYNIPLAFGVFRLAKKRIIVKNTNSLEYMAGMNNMITDYYGVAKDQIYIDSIYIEDTQIDQHNIYNLKNMVEPEIFNLFCEGITLNSKAYTALKNNEIHYFGNSIGCCLLKFLNSIQVDTYKIRDQLNENLIYSCTNLINDNLIYSSVKDNKLDFLVKNYYLGNPDQIINKIDSYITPGIGKREIDEGFSDKLKLKINQMIHNNIYPIILCYNETKKEDFNASRKSLNEPSKLIFISLIGLKNEVESLISDKIIEIGKLGVNYKLVTALSVDSLRIIAKQLGLIKNISKSISNLANTNNIMSFLDDNKSSKSPIYLLSNEAESFEKKPIINANEELSKIVSITFNEIEKKFIFNIPQCSSYFNRIYSCKAIANATGKDKFALIGTMSSQGDIIAMIGQRSSDAIPLKAAHAGIIFGENNYNDIIYEASDIIFEDEYFSNIFELILYGRNIYDCIRKFLQFQISFVGALMILMIISNNPAINIQFYHNKILYLNLIIDTLEALAMSIGKPSRKNILNKNSLSYSPHKNIISRNLFFRIFIGILLQLFIFLTVIVRTDVFYRSTMLYNTIMYMIVFNAIVTELHEDYFIFFTQFIDELPFILVQIIILITQNYFIYTGSKMLRMVEMNHQQNFKCFCYGLLILFQIPIIAILKQNEIFFKPEQEEIVYHESNDIKDENDIKMLGLRIDELDHNKEKDDIYSVSEKNDLEDSFSNI